MFVVVPVGVGTRLQKREEKSRGGRDKYYYCNNHWVWWLIVNVRYCTSNNSGQNEKEKKEKKATGTNTPTTPTTSSDNDGGKDCGVPCETPTSILAMALLLVLSIIDKIQFTHQAMGY